MREREEVICTLYDDVIHEELMLGSQLRSPSFSGVVYAAAEPAVAEAAHLMHDWKECLTFWS